MGLRVVLNGQLQWFGGVLDGTVYLEEQGYSSFWPSVLRPACCGDLSYESYLLSCEVPDRNTVDFQYLVPDVQRKKRVATEDGRVQPVRQFQM